MEKKKERERENQLNISVSVGVVDMKSIRRDEIPKDFWSKLTWFKKFAARPDLEIRIYKDKKSILQRMVKNRDIDVLLEMPEVLTSEDLRSNRYQSLPHGGYLVAHTGDERVFHEIENSLTEYRHRYAKDSFKGDSVKYPLYKCRNFSEDADDFSVVEKCDYLSFHTSFFNCFGLYEASLVSAFTNRIQSKDCQCDTDKIILDEIHINAYIQAVGGGDGGADVRNLQPIDNKLLVDEGTGRNRSWRKKNLVKMAHGRICLRYFQRPGLTRTELSWTKRIICWISFIRLGLVLTKL